VQAGATGQQADGSIGLLALLDVDQDGQIA
jgi:hypothetical protein